MQYPIYPDKYQCEALFSPQDFLSYRKKLDRLPNIKPPEGIILCYKSHILTQIVKAHPATKVKGLNGSFYILDETDGAIGLIGGFGIGAPAAVTVFEELIAFGTRKYLSIGTAGALQSNLQTGDIVVCDRAIRDEGTSYHYLKPDRDAYPSPKLTENLKNKLQQFQVKFHSGATWTIDAPYRETITEVNYYQKQGVLTVEMEAAALFAVAEFRNVEIGTILTISDSLAGLQWEPHFDKKKTKLGLELLFKVAYQVLLD